MMRNTENSYGSVAKTFHWLLFLMLGFHIEKTGAPERIGRRLRRLVVAPLLRLSRDFVALGSNL